MAQDDSSLFGVSIAAEPASDSVQEIGACTAHEVTVRNTGGSPIPQAHTIEVSTSAVPTGWRLDPEPPAELQLAAGASDSFDVGLCPTDQAEPDRAVSLTVTATVTEQASGNPSDSTRMSATLQEESLFGLDIPDSFLWLILAGLAVLVGIILVTRKRTTHGVTLMCAESAKEVHPGRGTSFPIRIRNEGSERDLVDLRVSDAPPGWDTFLPLADLALDAGEEQTVWLSVRSPAEATPGQHVTVRVKARSSSAHGETAAIDTHTRVAGATQPQGDPSEAEQSVLESSPRAEERPVAVKRKKGDA